MTFVLAEVVKNIKTVVAKVNKMDNKVILILVDGMRPDALIKCGNPFVKELEKISTYTYNGKTVFPSITLPCHYSMTHSVPTDRHGILTNTFVPLARPMIGIFELLKNYGKRCGMYYTWENLRDLYNPGAIDFSKYLSCHEITDDRADTPITDAALVDIEKYNPDFFFLYMGDPDNHGHMNGWMGEDYMYTVDNAVNNIKRVIEKFGDKYNYIILADHGGHDRMHGTDKPEDMTIPLYFIGKSFEKSKIIDDISILDVAPTIADLFGIKKPSDWEGKSVLRR